MIISLSVDAISAARESRRAVSFLLGAALLMVVLRFATASWRRVSPLHFGEAADGILYIDTTQWSQKLAAEKRRDSITQELRNFFAGARSSDSAKYPAGPLGSRLACGHCENKATMSLCA
ncbi:hypothetical protein [Streptomyces sp. SID9727]|uniref:hypothetical protein n=1 Tax=Streptomyces sp. SID9727 TaxID=2706114 RepID=UPI0013CBEAF2|nr:hypothetical protein [Streptomyces sp. SID9727]NEC68857.1 hypothetical protein [Streptomyces sp. SID9727]